MQYDDDDNVLKGVCGHECEKKYMDLQNRRRKDDRYLQSTYIPFLI